MLEGVDEREKQGKEGRKREKESKYSLFPDEAPHLISAVFARPTISGN